MLGCMAMWLCGYAAMSLCGFALKFPNFQVSKFQNFKVEVSKLWSFQTFKVLGTHISQVFILRFPICLFKMIWCSCIFWSNPAYNGRSKVQQCTRYQKVQQNKYGKVRNGRSTGTPVCKLVSDIRKFGMFMFVFCVVHEALWWARNGV